MILNLPSAFRYLAKSQFAECFFTLGKVVAECPKKILGKEPFADKVFAECLIHSAKNAIPRGSGIWLNVVPVSLLSGNGY
jgi:hypothetical protein